ncbi:hypothetical protein [Mesorhizobium sp. B2-8-5]|uniref:hypothetical protein n=1 Tax=Mesorhizobium sp. B2-8-5 TaxID=2589903 RepID=UPI0011265FC0|nr:hypothetical protein [Mesorhizobium sp. B2-8-5]UCI26643.1 hypothetical protein FJ430_03290 [Mesorhizobium sp. B2-8-5]
MSWNPAIEPGCPDEVGIDAIETLIVAPCQRRSGKPVGARRIGARGASICRSMTGMSMFLFRTDRR